MNKRQLKIFIADPEESIRLSMAGILDLEGFAAHTVADGFEAVSAARRESFDIAFLDIHMPGMNGVETFKKIKECSPETAVIMMSTYSVNDLVRDAIEEGAYACLTKPFDMDTIIDTISEVGAKPFVMVVDDDPDLCNLLYDRLRDAGCNVITKTSGMEGIEAARRHIPDVLFLDVMMNGLNGLETLKKINDLFGDKAPKTIIMSAYDSTENFDQAKKLGAVACMRKPLNMTKLKPMIDSLTRTPAGGRICIIEDDPELRASLLKTLAASGYQIDIAASSDDALTKLSQDTYSGVVMDLQKAHGNGVAAYDMIKQVDPDVGVIFIDGSSAQPPAATRARNNFSYLIKPFEPEQLLEMVRAIGRRKKK